ncbi:MAG: hypothetical protein ACR2JH_01045 [Solirubrobacteraceae bacterium]
MTTLRNLARWLAWQLPEADPPGAQPAARITVFSSPGHQRPDLR